MRKPTISEDKSMEIEIKRIITNEYPDFLVYNTLLNDLQDYLNKKFTEKNYGESVVKYFFGFELYKFDGGFAKFYENDIESWKTKNKWLVTNAHFDWNVFVEISQTEVLTIIKQEFLSSVDRIEKMTKKPKNFDNISFRNDLEEVLESYSLR